MTIKRFLPTKTNEDYNKVVVNSVRGNEQLKDLLDIEYLFNDEKKSLREFILDLVKENESLKKEIAVLRTDLENKVQTQMKINENLVKAFKEGGVI